MEKLRKQFRQLLRYTTIPAKDKARLVEDMITYYIKEQVSVIEAFEAMLGDR